MLARPAVKSHRRAQKDPASGLMEEGARDGHVTLWQIATDYRVKKISSSSQSKATKVIKSNILVSLLESSSLHKFHAEELSHLPGSVSL